MTKLVGAVLVALTLGVASATAKPDGDVRIRHGVGIGPIKLGMTYAQVRKILRRPPDGRSPSDSARRRTSASGRSSGRCGRPCACVA